MAPYRAPNTQTTRLLDSMMRLRSWWRILTYLAMSCTSMPILLRRLWWIKGVLVVSCETIHRKNSRKYTQILQFSRKISKKLLAFPSICLLIVGIWYRRIKSLPLLWTPWNMKTSNCKRRLLHIKVLSSIRNRFGTNTNNNRNKWKKKWVNWSRL